MKSITIPKISKNVRNLVAVPQTTYRAFIAWEKKTKSEREFVASKSEKKVLNQARKSFSHKKYVGVEDL